MHWIILKLRVIKELVTDLIWVGERGAWKMKAGRLFKIPQHSAQAAQRQQMTK